MSNLSEEQLRLAMRCSLSHENSGVIDMADEVMQCIKDKRNRTAKPALVSWLLMAVGVVLGICLFMSNASWLPPEWRYPAACIFVSVVLIQADRLTKPNTEAL